jgi:homoserine dehydrogenase
MNKESVKIGLLGLGTVGTGVVKTLQSHREQIEKRTGKQIVIQRILVRDPDKKRGVFVERERLTLSPESILEDQEISVIVEVMGGIEPANSIIRQALQTGRHVVTANKELMAKHGAELLELADKNGVQLWYEASVGGGIPIIRSLQSYLHLNRVQSVKGILNGTCNYILTSMERTGRSYSEVLKEAQALGYAEADPMNDVLGLDTLYKLVILGRLAFDLQIPPGAVETEGIERIEPVDIKRARSWGYAIKLIGAASLHKGTLTASVGPRLLPITHPLAQVDDVLNAVTVCGDVVGELTWMGKGAGERPTASAVLEDLVCLCQGGTGWRKPVTDNRVVRIQSGEAEIQTCYLRVEPQEGRADDLVKTIGRFIHNRGGTVMNQCVEREAERMHLIFLIQGMQKNVIRSFAEELDRAGLKNSPLLLYVEEAATQEEAFTHLAV